MIVTSQKKDTDKSIRITIHAHEKCYAYLMKRKEEIGERSLPKTVMQIIRQEKTLREKQDFYDVGVKSFSEKIEMEMCRVERKCEDNSYDIRKLKLIETETKLNRENILTMNEEIKALKSIIDKNIQKERDLKKQIQKLEQELNGTSPNALNQNDLVKRMKIELAPFVERTVISTLNTIEREMADDEPLGSDDLTSVLMNEQIAEIAAAETQAEYLTENEPKGGDYDAADDKGDSSEIKSE